MPTENPRVHLWLASRQLCVDAAAEVESGLRLGAPPVEIKTALELTEALHIAAMKAAALAHAAVDRGEEEADLETIDNADDLLAVVERVRLRVVAFADQLAARLRDSDHGESES